jgi:two-component system, cell cycle sensor histidine kinase and response regulator CckA
MTEHFRDNQHNTALNNNENLLVRAEQIKLLYRNAPVSMIASVINPCILVIILWNAVNHQYLLAWAAGVILVTAFRYSDVIRFQRAAPAPSQALNRFTLGTFLSGIMWGSAGVIIFPSESLVHQTFLAFVLGGMVTGSAGAYSVVKRTFFSFCIPVIAPIIIRFFLIADLNHITMASMILLFAVLVTAMAMYMHNMNINSLRIRFENKNLISYLDAAKADAENLAQDLTREIAMRKNTEEQLNQHKEHLQELVEERNTELLSANDQLRKEIRERLRAEKALKQSEEYFRSLIENTQDLIAVVDREGKILYLNPSVEQLLGYWQEDLYHMNIFEFIHPEDKQTAFEKFGSITQKPGNVESLLIRIKHHNGSWNIFEAIGKSIMKDSGSMNVVINSRDVTERRKIEEELSKVQKLESVGILAGGIAHDFNNLLQAIMGNISLSKILSDPAGKTYDLLGKAEQAAEQARDLSYRLLTFSKGGEPFRQLISLKELLVEAVTLALSGSGIAPGFAFEENLYTVKVDESQIRQVIRNIVENAKEAMPDGGTFTAGANNIDIGAKDNLPLKEGRYLHISFTDQGIGIPEKSLSRIFDPYFSTKEMGTEKGQGLGLAICHSIVSKHEGLITVESQPGKGTTFHIYLPAAEQALPAAIKEGGQLPGRRVILFMDDEVRVRDIGGKMLESLGYGVELAKNGEEAIEAFRKARESGRSFDAVILDLTVKEGMSGREAIRRLKEIDPGIKAIVSSGYADDPIMKDFNKHGFMDAIAKPYTIEELQALLAKL